MVGGACDEKLEKVRLGPYCMPGVLVLDIGSSGNLENGRWLDDRYARVLA